MQWPPVGVACFNCDLIYDNLPDEVREDGTAAQDAILSHWVTHVLSDNKIELAVLDTQEDSGPRSLCWPARFKRSR
jgi:hypothetical protein